MGLNAHLGLMSLHLMQVPCGAIRGVSLIRKALKTLLDLLAIFCYQEYLEVIHVNVMIRAQINEC